MMSAGALSALLGNPPATAASLDGTLAAPPPYRPPELQRLDETQARMVAEAKDKALPMPKVTITNDPAKGPPTADLSMTAEDLQGYMEKLRKADQVLAAFSDRSAQLERQIKNTNPILNALAQISGQLSQSPDMPGWLQGLGRANLALNPTVPQLQQERQGIMQTVAQLAGQSADREFQVRRAITEDKRAEAERLAKVEEARQTNVEQLRKTLLDRLAKAAPGSDPALLLGSQDAVESAFRGLGLPASRAAAEAAQLFAMGAGQRTAAGQGAEFEIAKEAAAAAAKARAELPAKMTFKDYETQSAYKLFGLEEKVREAFSDKQKADEFLRAVKLQAMKAEGAALKSQLLPPDRRKALEAANVAEAAIGRLVGDPDLGLTGPVVGRFFDKFSSLAPPEQRKVKAELNVVIDRYLKAAQSGRISDSDRKIVGEWLGGMENRPDQIRAAMRVLQEGIQTERLEAARAYVAPGGWNGADKALLGHGKAADDIVAALTAEGIRLERPKTIVDDPVQQDPARQPAPAKKNPRDLKVGQKVRDADGYVIERVAD